METKRATVFLALTFFMTWTAWWLLAYLTHVGVVEFGTLRSTVLFMIGGSAPTIAAYIAVLATPAAGPLVEFNRRVFSVRHASGYYAFALLGPPALGAAGAVVAAIATGGAAFPYGLGLLIFLPSLVISLFLGGLEELGWRGVLQPAVSRLGGVPLVSLIIGVIWGVWHLPLFFVVGSVHRGGSFLFYALAAPGFSACMTWLYARTESVFLCVLFHAGINAAATSGLWVPIQDGTPYAYYTATVFLGGVILLLVSGRKTARSPAPSHGYAGAAGRVRERHGVTHQ